MDIWKAEKQRFFLISFAREKNQEQIIPAEHRK